MHLNIVFVLLYSVCRSVNGLSCVDVIQYSTYLLRAVVLDVTKRRGERVREKVRGDTNGLLQIPSKKKKKKREEFLAVAPLLLPTSNLLLPSTVYMYIYIRHSTDTWTGRGSVMMDLPFF